MQDLLIYVILGLCIGVMSGFFGIGGGFILTPTLILMGFSPVIAIATSLLYTVATSLSGVVAHFRLKHIKWETSIIIGISGVIATQFAHPFVIFLKKYQIENTVIPLMYLVLILYFSISILVSNSPSKEQAAGKTNFAYGKIVLIGLFAGFISTALGVGGGFIIVPLLMSVLAFQPKYAVGTSLLSVFMIVVAGFATYASTVELDYGVIVSLIIGALIGGQLGAMVTNIYEDKQVRYFLAGLYIATGVSLVFKLFHLDFVGLLFLLIYCLYMLIHFVLHTFKLRLKEKEVG
ncbi:sulfite exporter TauE/SafE family protein [Bacillus timonensis]|uniref:Probable membrane transporter protein n=1 Tax=Bacillus timonensis TaxID=1033734 RepID=A0A4S3PMZ0_9BACI|nr:sulfite exporter TauE/SafE family protein [Bacillus timonensis]THE10921.1 sulfite exporter TauE/SafE family protein [Bacillus timonensis]